MPWKKCTFSDAVLDVLAAFKTTPHATSFALVWRSGDEYIVMDHWWVKHIFTEMDEKKLRVVLWLTQNEAAHLTQLLSGGN
jgi:hypothetical protein